MTPRLFTILGLKYYGFLEESTGNGRNDIGRVIRAFRTVINVGLRGCPGISVKVSGIL